MEIVIGAAAKFLLVCASPGPVGPAALVKVSTVELLMCANMGDLVQLSATARTTA